MQAAGPVSSAGAIMSRSFLFIGVVTIWAISITLADKTSSQGKQHFFTLSISIFYNCYICSHAVIEAGVVHEFGSIGKAGFIINYLL